MSARYIPKHAKKPKPSAPALRKLPAPETESEGYCGDSQSRLPLPDEQATATATPSALAAEPEPGDHSDFAILPRSHPDLLNYLRYAHKTKLHTPVAQSSATAEPLLGAWRGKIAALPTPASVSELDLELSLAIAEAGIAVQRHPELAFPPLEPAESRNERALTQARRRWPRIIAILLILILVVGTVSYAILYRQAIQREINRSNGYESLNMSIALIQQSDPEVIAMDDAIKSEVSAEDLAQRRVILDKVPTTLETLRNAVSKAQSSLQLFTSDADRELAERALAAGNNRLEMLSSGSVLLENDIKAMNCTLLLGQAWDLIVRADEDMRSAAELSKGGGYRDLDDAVALNKAVLEQLNQASELVAQAQGAFTDTNFSTINDYLKLKKESVVLAIGSDQALLDTDLNTAYSQNDAFVLKDMEVVAAAAKIPADPFTLITLTYETTTSTAKQRYDSARTNVTEADAHIREYLGVETQIEVQ